MTICPGLECLSRVSLGADTMNDINIIYIYGHIYLFIYAYYLSIIKMRTATLGAEFIFATFDLIPNGLHLVMAN